MKDVLKKAVTVVLIATLIFAISAVLSACGNMQVYDIMYTFEYGIVRLPDGSIVEGTVQSWTDYDDGGSDFIQVKIDGVTYYTNSTNVVLIHK